MQLKNENGKTIIIFDEVLSITLIHEQQNTYQEALKLAKPIVLQSAAINFIDTASFQLLLCFLLSIKEQKMMFEWQGSSVVLCHSAAMLGMEVLLGLPGNDVQAKQ